ncbi:UDP-N-acetylmuramyl peptide synthase [Bifidobacterium crudilactis]|jgi:UDP-N-acetylmuramyl tripeptide synthase|uniref:UDP-N-acetylmuramyl peptide synthase n=2 Tax=Bifidobacterium crudilactis TaxID=327277 RepID=A0A971ICS7_9BIFI|nr:UDP-N-acetylmuramyl peptide synthase [Bifidobacterium crudilactis]MCI1867512.1 UDP-N-acetylmuramyl peptide synthase [Bifidobacterium crudilactis]MDN5972837.1 UDP-N-acetylmuramyl peptide synthase [Bifidobacterium crudilactis]MDN6000134.1 UDP-N-acetylmuramyl peptide synthase [Bifidobacterium crudilactis]MDN6234592.1 UDP-N-acetylmuramyl peptide synthase [Bifidobacterium crudilactis]MDN6271551.1 UDP-N-acetylmuramyl peptide synthase [Bifidobacterium crudilactis]
MTALGESLAQRMTLGYLCTQYGLVASPRFSEPVTVTSIADDIDSIRPGSLLLTTGQHVDAQLLADAEMRGAYAILAPAEAKESLESPDIPVLFGDLDTKQVAELAADIAGKPSESLAVFVVYGEDASASVKVLAEFLHVLGNPVGVVSATGSFSLDRQLDIHYPLSALDMQRLLSVCVEDGASAIAICADSRTLQKDALHEVEVDVLSLAQRTTLRRGQQDVLAQQASRIYGFALGDRTGVAARNEDSDTLAVQSNVFQDDDSTMRLSLSIAMVMSAGVKKNNIRSALRVSRELS